MLGALIGLGASVIGGVLSSKSTKKAADKAADAEIAASTQNNALIRELYERNTGNFTPYMQSGARANALLDSFIYGDEPAVQPAPATTAGPSGFAPQSFSYSPNGGGAGYVGGDRFQPQNTPYEPMNEGAYGGGTWAYNQGIGQPIVAAQPTAAAPRTGNALSGYQQFEASPYFQFPYQQGMKALNTGLASSGRLESGGAMKAAVRFGQDYGAGRMDEYLNLVRGQQAQGFGGASALAGVGQNMVSETGANNRASADALANAALLKSQANQGLYNALGSGVGFLSSYIR